MESGENRLGVPPPKKMLAKRATSRQRQILIQVRQQCVDIFKLAGNACGALCELKSQYGHLRTHQGMWMYSDSGIVVMLAVVRATSQAPARDG